MRSLILLWQLLATTALHNPCHKLRLCHLEQEHCATAPRARRKPRARRHCSATLRQRRTACKCREIPRLPCSAPSSAALPLAGLVPRVLLPLEALVPRVLLLPLDTHVPRVSLSLEALMPSEALFSQGLKSRTRAEIDSSNRIEGSYFGLLLRRQKNSTTKKR